MRFEKMATLKQPLRILCFGDSLTEGYSQHGLTFTPYSETLLQTLQQSSIGGHWEIEVDTDGMSGDAVTYGFRDRMEEHCIYFPFPSLPFHSPLSPPSPSSSSLSISHVIPQVLPF
jgi:hypothetical protein